MCPWIFAVPFLEGTESIGCTFYVGFPIQEFDEEIVAYYCSVYAWMNS